MPNDPELIEDLKKADLRYVSDNVAGITRKKNGKLFKYFDTDKKRITSTIVLDRIKNLAIPPAWSNVWICPSPSDYLQATGFIAKLIKECIELPGYEIFKYLGDDEEKHVLDSSDINRYLQSLTGEDITAKDFRTWGGTVLCATTLHVEGPFETEVDGKKKISKAVRKVSKHLRNTAPVCRNYYIHPVIFETYQKSVLIPHFEDIYRKYDRGKTEIARDEFATFTLISKYS